MYNTLLSVIDVVYSFPDSYVVSYNVFPVGCELYVEIKHDNSTYVILLRFDNSYLQMYYNKDEIPYQTGYISLDNFSDEFRNTIDMVKRGSIDSFSGSVYMSPAGKETIVASANGYHIISELFGRYTDKCRIYSFNAHHKNDISVQLSRKSNYQFDRTNYNMTNSIYFSMFWYDYTNKMLYHSLNGNRANAEYSYPLENAGKLIQARLQFDRKIELAREIQNIKEF